MLVEIFPRLAVRLRSVFPGASIKLVRDATALKISFANAPEWEVDVTGVSHEGQPLLIQSCLTLRYDALQNIHRDDFLRFIAGENFGLRGATLRVDPEDSSRTIRVCSAFYAQKGRSRDEAENLAIDVLSLFRFAKLLDDRVQRSLSGDDFCFELYYSTYLSKSVGRNRYINYARGVFTSNANHIFQAAGEILRDDFKHEVEDWSEGILAVKPADSPLELTLRLPQEIPMLICLTNLSVENLPPRSIFGLVALLNEKVSHGHFEVSIDGAKLSFVTWKQLTNDMRSRSLNQLVQCVIASEQIFANQLQTLKTPSKTPSKEKELQASSSPAAMLELHESAEVGLDEVLLDNLDDDYASAA